VTALIITITATGEDFTEAARAVESRERWPDGHEYSVSRDPSTGQLLGWCRVDLPVSLGAAVDREW
jgi:hypothetical protein